VLVFTPNGRLTCYGRALARLLARHPRVAAGAAFLVVRKRSIRSPGEALARCSVPVRVLLSHPAARSGRHLGDVSDRNVSRGWVRSTRPDGTASSTKWFCAHGTGAEPYSDKTAAAPPWRAARRGV
jgi:hypothetical protein